MEDACAAYFDVNKTTTTTVDASPLGLGSVITQDGRAIVYASRFLSDVESRSNRTEREALGIVWSCEHFDRYLQGDPQFTVSTDHESLLATWKKPRPKIESFWC